MTGWTGTQASYSPTPPPARPAPTPTSSSCSTAGSTPTWPVSWRRRPMLSASRATPRTSSKVCWRSSRSARRSSPAARRLASANGHPGDGRQRLVVDVAAEPWGREEEALHGGRNLDPCLLRTAVEVEYDQAVACQQVRRPQCPTRARDERTSRARQRPHRATAQQPRATPVSDDELPCVRVDDQMGGVREPR